ncbi:Arginine/ornithine antiporter ArcD [Marinobacterium lacunae]|uniref:Arginine/ornithine antiporter ArcD n=1 Tax=Marinobacterium lacunae TaxID=1232683 RepID=A0A081G0P9_9GAMM|nr:DUF368 domain-containing protein [Marinobacterium lacunae]KEA64354.1 Arginine/ornithine antiporter ArcD [Marinobacterium lacunae]MBR9883012.1 DUF368 domain-containing protein [Oceanospirillales bacterium]
MEIKVRTPKDYLALAGKGMMMGAADAVPGVSGGTVAFITGIYEELIDTLRSFDLQALMVLYREGIGAFWRHVNGTFLVTLLGGILLSLLSLSRVVLFMLDQYPVLLWAFFFGLILASVWSLMRHVQGWNLSNTLIFFTGALLAYLITSLTPGTLTISAFTLFGSGMVAICAMILPGISGSFILLLMGMYAPILSAVKHFELYNIGLFAAGCAVGLISFSRLLSWAFHHHRKLVLALLGGFMLGSLNKVWPWKYTLAYTIDRHGDSVPLLQRNVLPDVFTQLTGQAALLLPALVLMAVGVVLVVLLDRHNG